MAGSRNPLGDETSTHPYLQDTSTAAARLSLLVIGKTGVVSHDLPESGRVTLGRSTQCDIQIQEQSISRVHAVIELGPPVTITDQGSTHGVIVGRRKLGAQESATVTLGDVVELGAVMVVIQAGPVQAGYGSWYGNEGRTSPPPAVASVASMAPRTVVPSSIIVRDPAMQRLYELVQRVGVSSIVVLLLGETGVGKEVFAEALHRHSPRASRAFLRLNCAALSANLLESELFGYEKGAFTGAQHSKAGLLESAEGGTVFLDEVGEMPIATQIKLLRVLEERKVLRVGGLIPRPIDVRFIAATNRDLRADVNAGNFRQDLYFRLNGISISIPPLRERVAEVEPLARLFISRAATLSPGASEPSLSEEALSLLQNYSWPGNIRELRNVLERAVVLSGGAPITTLHLPPEVVQACSLPRSMRISSGPLGLEYEANPRPKSPTSAPPGALRSEIEAIERRKILDALEKCVGNQTRAAELLGMPRRTLVAKLRTYEIPRPRKGPRHEPG